MLMVKTYLTFQHNKEKYEVYGGQNRANSKEYLYFLVKPDLSEKYIGYYDNKKQKYFFECKDDLDLPDKIIKKIGNLVFNS